MKFIIENGKLLKVKKINKKDKQIIIPDGVICIGQSAFSYCNCIEEIVLPNTVKIIERYAFSNSNFEKINIPSSVVEIGESAFSNCYNLKEITIPNSIDIIKNNTFSYCSNLKEVNLPNSLKEIESGAFNGCTSLINITLPNLINKIEKYTFNNCFKLSSINFSSSLYSIGEAAFKSCESLMILDLPVSLKVIEKEAFYKCHKLQEVKLPSSIKKIESVAFGECENLKSISIPNTIENLANNSFLGSSNINEFTFGKEKMINCATINGLEEIKEINPLFISDKQIESKYIDIIKTESETYINDNITSSIILATTLNKDDICKMRELTIILPFLTRNHLLKENYVKALNEIKNNRKEFQKIIKLLKNDYSIKKYYHQIKYYDLYKLAHTLGAFSDSQIDRQRACEFLINAIIKRNIKFENIHDLFESLKFNGFNREWSEFFMDKKVFPELILLELEQTGYIARIYNAFNEIKEFGRSNRGNQHYRKVTVEMAKEYLSFAHFTNVNSLNMDIAETISQYTRNQSSFDNANEIREKYLKLKEEGKINDHLINEELKEKDVFEQIEEEKKNSLNGMTKTLDILNKLSNKKFTYEFLSKYDSKNFVLGKYCSCCAHLEGVGYGIMKASILHPDCQNLIIKNDKGKIIAKSTLYINRNQGYGVCNNIEISLHITDKEKKQMIYNKFIEAIDKFATEYNKKNPSNPLTQINVGMNLNDLKDYLRRNNQKGLILKGINFSEFGGYSGDWQKEQYVVWKNNKKSKNM